MQTMQTGRIPRQRNMVKSLYRWLFALLSLFVVAGIASLFIDQPIIAIACFGLDLISVGSNDPRNYRP